MPIGEVGVVSICMHFPFPFQFMLIFKYAKEGTLEIDGLKKIAATCDVTTEGVGGAKTFFEAKAKEVSQRSQRCLSILLD